MPFYPVQNPDIKKTLTIGGEPNDTISIKPPDYFSKEMYVSSSELESYLTDSHSTSCSERNGPTPSMISSNFTLHQHIQYYEPDITSPAAAGSHVPTTRSLVKKKRKNPQRGKRAVASITGEIDSTMSVPCFSLQSTAPTLKPIGVFWDIENCQVPRFKSAIALVELIRRKYLVKFREAEFVVVCDTHKERKEVITELNNAQVTIVHVACTSKNAADDKLRQCMRRFTDNIGIACAVMLISSDVNFAVDLSDFKNRKKIHVIVVHGQLASETLLLCSSEHYLFQDLLKHVPSAVSSKVHQSHEAYEYLYIWNLPAHIGSFLVRQRVEQIMENCGGKMVHLQGARGVIKFATPLSAQRALLRMEGEDVFGSKISLSEYSRVGSYRSSVPTLVDSPPREMIEAPRQRHFSPFPPPPNPALVAPPRLLDFCSSRSRCNDKEHVTASLQLPQTTDLTQPPQHLESLHVDDSFRRAVADADGPNRWDYYRTPSEYLVEKTPQGHRRIRGVHKVGGQTTMGSSSSSSSSKLSDGNRTRNSAAAAVAASATAPRLPPPQSAARPTASVTTGAAEAEDRAAYIPFTVAETVKANNELKAAAYSYSSSASSASSNASNSTASVDLHVTNLDQSIGAKEMKHLLTTVFKQHVIVMSVTVHLQSDGHLAAVVRVPSVQDAQYCVSQLHRRKLGNKRIMIAYDQNGGASASGRNTPTPLQIRAQVNTLLSEIPQRRLPLFKFRELYEQRFHTSVSLADLHRLRDVLYVTDDVHGRCVVFLQQTNQQYTGEQCDKDVSSTPRSLSSEPELSISEMPRCPVHDPASNGGSHGWAEPEPLPELPLVFSTLHQISLHIHGLLQSHGGSLPLASVPRCYEMEICALTISEDQGVPLEHLISCVKGVGIVNVAGHKRLQWAGKNDQSQDSEPLQSLNPSLLPQMSLLCRELVDLLKMASQCRVPFSKFIPAYHHHFGRQCRVADYGYTRLIDLLEALSHVVQILGEGNRRYVTLSHRAQVKRFTSDLLRILKAQASKQISVELFASLYEKTLSRTFDPRDYGLCHLSDLLAQVAEASVVVMATADGHETIALPKREQTFEEMERTKQFAIEVIELLKHAPQCKLDFAKFIPAYHHHFGRQCRVADYGCTKLVELFETIPDTVQVFELDNEIEKFVQLTTKQRLKILAEQVATLVKNNCNSALPLNTLPDAFRLHFGFALRPLQYETNTLEELVAKLRSHVQVVYSERGAEVTLIDQNALSQAKNRVLRLLYPIADGCMSLHHLLEQFKENYGHECPLSFITNHMEEIIEVDNSSFAEPLVRLVPLTLFCRQVHLLLNENGGRLPLANFETSFLSRFGSPCRPSQYGHSSCTALLQSLPRVVVLRGKGPRRVLILSRDVEDLTPPPISRAPKTSEIKPPAHWLIPKVEKKAAEVEEVIPKSEVYEDLKQLFMNANSSSSVVYGSVPAFMPPVPWSPMWSMGMTMSMSSSYASANASFPHGWNMAATLPNYPPCNYWVTAWPTPCPFPLPITTVSKPNLSSRASVEEIEDVATTSCQGTPPAASLLPRPSLTMTASLVSEEEISKSNPIKSRIAAQFRNPVKPID